LIFLLDSSGSVGLQNYQKEKNFIKDIVSKQNIGRELTRVGVVVYSHEAIVAIKLTDYSSTEDLNKAIDGIDYYGKTTRIDKGLMTADRIDQVFTVAAGSRPYLPRVLVLLTDGRQTRAPGYKPLKTAVCPLKKKQVKTLAVGVGRGIDARELRELVDHDDDMVMVSDFDDLRTAVYPLHTKSREITSNAMIGEADQTSLPPVNGIELITVRIARDFTGREDNDGVMSCNSYQELPWRANEVATEAYYPRCPVAVVDICFILDASGSVSPIDFKQQKAFVKALAKTFLISPEKTRVAILSFSTIAKLNIKLTDFYDYKALTKAVDKIPYMGFTTRIDRAL
ncbi:predicted protein, partial [Nematostella vectensis]